MIRSGLLDRIQTVEPQGWISRHARLHERDEPLEILDEQDLLAADRLASDGLAHPVPGVLLEEALLPDPDGQRTSASGRPTTCGRIQSAISA